MNYMFIVSNLDFGDKILHARDIANKLLSNGIWAFATYSPNIKRFEEGDKGVIYLAGKDNKIFIANFIFNSKVEDWTEKEVSDDIKNIISIFPLVATLRDINIWPNALSIHDVISELDFIENKVHYGLYLRGVNIL